MWVGGGGGRGTKKIGGGSPIGTKKIGFGRAAADFFGIWGSEHDSECDFRNSQNQEKTPKIEVLSVWVGGVGLGTKK